MKSLKEFKTLLKLLGEYKTKLLIAGILIFIIETSSLLIGYLNGRAIESITNKMLNDSLMFLLLYLALLLFINITRRLVDAMLSKVESIISRRMSYYTYKKALDLPAAAYEKYTSGEIINRIINDTDTLSLTFQRLLGSFSYLIGSVIVMVYIFINSWIVGLFILLCMLALFIIIKKYNPLLKNINKDMKKEYDKFTSLTTESIRGIREIKTLGVKNNLLSNISDTIKMIQKKNELEIDTRKKFDLLIGFVRSILEVGTFIICAVLLFYGETSLTFFIAMTYYVYRYMWFIDEINNLMQMYQKTTVALGRVNEILENKLYEDEEFGDKKIKNVKGVVEFKNVYFGYPNEDITLKNFNLKLEPNKKIAIIGKSGQGKSTLFNLVTRIFDPDKGEILLDGINIKDLTEDELRKHISIIRQEPFIFNRSIKDNFRILKRNVKLDEIRKYTKMAYIDDYIMSLPNKYNTILGEGGVNLSGGQKQRMAIARTLLKQSKVILFDEATSALDNESQEYIKKAIDDLAKDHTIVIVAHRLSTIVDADVIYLVDKGHIVATGTHNELLKSSKIYKKLYEKESL